MIAGMRSLWRTIGPTQRRDIALVGVADGIVGLAFGALAVAAGLPAWVPMLMSVLVFAGGAQFAAVSIVAAGGSAAAAVVAGLVLNARHLPFGFAVADVFERGGGWRRALDMHWLIDESVAFTLRESEPARRRAVYLVAGGGLFVIWNLAVVAGAVAGSVLPDPAALGLDAAFPAVLLALVGPHLKDRRTRAAALTGAAVALATVPFLPAGLPVLLSLVGLAVLISPARRTVA